MDTRTEQLIESWFANMLSEAEAAELRQRLANDPDAAAEFAWQQSLAHAVRSGGLGSDPLHTKLHELERRFQFRRVIFQLAAVAAAIVALIVAIWLINPPGPQHNEDQIAAIEDTLQNPGFIPQETVPSQNPPSEELSPKEQLRQDSIQAEKAMQQQRIQQAKRRAQQDSLRLDVIVHFQHFRNDTEFNNAGGGGTGKEKEMAMNAFILYDKKDYRQATRAFKSVVAANPADVQYQFYYGVALIGDQQYESAAKVIRLVTEQESNYQTQAKYYLGLANTGTGQYKAARQAFQDYLAAPDNRQFKDLAEKMLKKLPPQ